MEQENHRGHDVNPLFVGLMGVIAGAIIVATVHCMLLGWCNGEEGRPQSPENGRGGNVENNNIIDIDRGTASSSSMSSSSAQLIPILKYTKDCKEGACAICLGEFTENEELRILPECAHPFHVACIDMWLYTHPNCPLCRADILPPLPDDHVVVSLADDVGAVSSPDLSVAVH